MLVPASPNSDSSLTDDRRLERFLELAAPVLLDEPDVEGEETWRELKRLADRAGLSDGELRGVVESLRQEGVLAGSDTSRGSSEPTVHPISDEDVESYLAPLPQPRRSMPPPLPIAERWRAAAAEARRDPIRFLTGDPAAGKSPAQLKAQIRTFLQQAEGVIAEQRGLTPRACMLLTDLAHSMGLAEGDFDEALAILRSRSGSRNHRDSAAESLRTTPASTTPPSTTPTLTTPISTTPISTTPISTTPISTTPISTTPISTTTSSAEPANTQPPSRKRSRAHHARPLVAGERDTRSANDRSANDRSANDRSANSQDPPPDGSDTTSVSSRSDGIAESAPADRFRKYLAIAIVEKQRTRGYLSESAERKLVGEGVHKLGLSPVFAGHLVLEVAEQFRIPVFSQQRDACAEPLDERLERFIARAGPILAQQRGATQRAYVLLSTLARELGLEDALFQRGMKLLQSVGGESDREGVWLQQRRAAWREHLQRALHGLSGQVLTPAELDDLVRIGVERFGLEESAVLAIVRQLAGELRVHLIWREQAVAHMRAVVGQACEGQVRLDGATAARLAAEGEQWGITSEQTRQIIHEQGVENLRRRRQERRLATMAVVGGFIATVVAMLSFYVFVFLPRLEAKRALESEFGSTDSSSWRSTPEVSSTEDGDSRKSGSIGIEKANRLHGEYEADKGTAGTAGALVGGSSGASGSTGFVGGPRRATWWDDGMRIAWVNLRRELSEGQLSQLQGVEGESTDSRAAAYTSLIRMVIDEEFGSTVARHAHDFVSRAVAMEPAEAAVEHWLNALLDFVPDMDEEIPAALSDYSRTLRAVRLASVALLQARKVGGNRTRIAERMQRKLPAVVTDETSAVDLEREYVAELMRRWCHNVTNAARILGTARIAEHWMGIRPTMARNLPRDEQLRLTVEMLRVALPRADDDWRSLQLAIQDAILSPDTNHVLRMAGVFERVRSEEPRRYMAALLLSRAEVSFQDLGSLDDVPRLVRQALGAPEGIPLDEGELADRWNEQVEEVLANIKSASASDQQVILQTMQLARLASWGMALARNQSSAAILLARRGDAELTSPEDDLPSDHLGRLEFSPSSAPMIQADPLRAAADMLRRGSGAWQQRMRGLDVISRAVPSQPDLLSADVASDVAGYLFSSRSGVEHRERLSRVHFLRDSIAMRIAMAHEVGEVSPQDQAARETIGVYLGEDLDLLELGTQWPRTIQRQLLEQAIRQLPSSEESNQEHALEQLQDLLRDECREHAQLLGIPASQWSELATAAEVRRVILKFHAEALGTRARERSAENDFPQRVPGEILAAEYIAPHDLAFTIMLERLWLKLVIWEYEFEGRDRSASQEILQELQKMNQGATGLLEQLRATQMALVKFWRIRI